MITLEKRDSKLGDVEKRYLTDAWREAQKTYTIYNPANGERVAEVADCGKDEASQAAEVASQAFESWRDTTAFERSALLLRWRDLIMAHQEELARTMTMEMGKPITEARGEVAYAAGFVTWYAEEAKRVDGDMLAPHAPRQAPLCHQTARRPDLCGHALELSRGHGHAQGGPGLGGGLHLYS